jgi:hypothetical protein
MNSTSAYQPEDLLARCRTKQMQALMRLLAEKGWRTEFHDRKMSFRHPLSGSEFVTPPPYDTSHLWGSPFFWGYRGIKVLMVSGRGDPNDLRCSLMLRWGGVPWVLESEGVLTYKTAMERVREQWPPDNWVPKPQ